MIPTLRPSIRPTVYLGTSISVENWSNCSCSSMGLARKRDWYEKDDFFRVPWPIAGAVSNSAFRAGTRLGYRNPTLNAAMYSVLYVTFITLHLGFHSYKY
ncbi:hypothetical protein TNCV_4622561 [Trichonephila clavipes]|nr:hypothetical protein TNCV_4622561 [Trichonephila clavipes]